MLVRLAYRVGVVGLVILLITWWHNYFVPPILLIAGISRLWWLLQWGPLARPATR